MSVMFIPNDEAAGDQANDELVGKAVTLRTRVTNFHATVAEKTSRNDVTSTRCDGHRFLCDDCYDPELEAGTLYLQKEIAKEVTRCSRWQRYGISRLHYSQRIKMSEFF